MRANERVYMGFGQNTEEVMIDALSQSQETALLLGTDLENTGKADLVPLLETYCEDLYVMSQNLHSKKQMAKLYKKIKKELKLLYDHIENEIETDRLCFVFLPYKVSMWDSMETVWKAADKDPDCDAYVVPIPYFDRDQEGNLAVEHYEVAVHSILGKEDAMSYRAIPGVVYTNPEIAGVGETEESASAKGITYKVVKLPMAYSGRFVAENEGVNGVCKVLLDEQERIIGAHVLGNPASEIITLAGTAIELGLTAAAWKKVVFPHPTVGEIFREAL